MMRLREKATEAIDSSARFLYQGIIRRFIEKIGAKPWIFAVYWRIYSLLASDEHTIRVNGIEATFNTPTQTEHRAIANVEGERDVLADLISRLNSEDVFWDVGANVGVYTCLAARCLGEGDVFAFEPHPENVRRLKDNLRLNALEATVHQVALSNSSGVANLEIDDRPAGIDILGPSLAQESNSTDSISVPVRRGDDIMANDEIDPPSVVKIDVEGQEYAAIEGMSSVLQRDNCRLIYCEIHTDHENSVIDRGVLPQEVQERLRSLDFNLEVIDKGPGHINIKGQKISTEQSRDS